MALQPPAGQFSSSSAPQGTGSCGTLRSADPGPAPFHPGLLGMDGFAGTLTHSLKTRTVLAHWGTLVTSLAEARCSPCHHCSHLTLARIQSLTSSAIFQATPPTPSASASPPPLDPPLVPSLLLFGSNSVKLAFISNASSQSNGASPSLVYVYWLGEYFLQG